MEEAGIKVKENKERRKHDLRVKEQEKVVEEKKVEEKN